MQPVGKIPIRPFLALSVIGLLTFSGLIRANAAGILLTYAEDPGRQISSLANTSYITFDNLPNPDGSLTWAGVGTYDDVAIINANIYGGAGGSGKYLVQSTNVPPGGAVATTTLTLNTPSSYFGLWWSAGDPANRLTFYNGASLIADFTTASLVNVLPNSYKGNPTTPFLDQNSGERYAFFNIYGQEGASWDKIIFSNANPSGFESDNHTTRVEAWGTLPGESGPEPGVAVMKVDGTNINTNLVAVPETSTWVMGTLALGAVIVMVRRGTKSAA